MNNLYLKLLLLLLVILIAQFIMMKVDEPEVPNIDGVMMRNEAQMYNGY